MNIIICGAGKVGFSISKQLSAQGHSITVVDQSSEFIQKIDDTQDVKGIVGRATFPSVLEKAGAEEASLCGRNTGAGKFLPQRGPATIGTLDPRKQRFEDNSQ